MGHRIGQILGVKTQRHPRIAAYGHVCVCTQVLYQLAVCIMDTVYTHFVTRSLRHPGEEMHIVSPGYTHFVTLCTSSPG